MSEKPGCFGHVLNSRDWLKTKGIELIKDCKECDLLTDCTAKYNANAYNKYVDDWMLEDQTYTPEDCPDPRDDEWDDDDDEDTYLEYPGEEKEPDPV